MEQPRKIHPVADGPASQRGLHGALGAAVRRPDQRRLRGARAPGPRSGLLASSLRGWAAARMRQLGVLAAGPVSRGRGVGVR